MGRFVKAYPLANVIPADYNPRYLSDDAFALLRESIRALGLIRPIIVTDAGRLIAGHQRTRGMKAEAITTSPAFVMSDVGPTDEIRFNQIHNASDVEFGTQRLRVPPFHGHSRYVEIDPSCITGDSSGRMAAKRNDLLRLLAQHGPFSSSVVTQSGEIIIGKQYAVACRTIGIPLLVYVLPDELRETAIRFFDQTYGVFSYNHLPRTTWGQTLAQMYRLRSERKANRSSLYEKLVIPNLKKNQRILDFGAGQMDYVRKLQRMGYDIRGYEPYFRTGNAINVSQVHRDIDQLCDDLATNGRYDVVICDSVLNSVDSLQAEADVLTSLNALARVGGTVYFSGRSRPDAEYLDSQLFAFRSAKKRSTHYFDGDGFTAIFSRGIWRYQKMHTYDQVWSLSDQFFGTDWRLFDDDGHPIAPRADVDQLRYTHTWKVQASKHEDLDRESCEASLAREFDMPLPDGKSYGRQADVVAAWRTAIETESGRIQPSGS